MNYAYTTRDGQRMEVNVAADYDRMNDAFFGAFGLRLRCNSGTRTDAEQEAIFRARYVIASQVNGRHVYDTRWWAGQMWFRISSAGTVAAPGSSNHQESGPNGPRSIDISDTGGDPGVMTRGTVRDRWMEAHAHEFEFENEGYKFGEPWHKTNRGAIGGGAPAGGGAVTFNPTVQAQQNWMNTIGINVGEADGEIGPLFIAGVKAYQERLRGWGYDGAIDGEWGPATQAAHQKYYDEWNAPKPGQAPPWPLAANEWFGPEQGGDQSISGHYSHNEDLKRWQKRMQERGWIFSAIDGLYGPKGSSSTATETGNNARAFQVEKGYEVDGLIGPETWKGAWEAPVTPVDPPVVTPPPVEPPPVDPTEPEDEEALATPNLVQPTAADFPDWIRFEEVWDKSDYTNKPTLNFEAQKYYKKPYNPIESHTHWWGAPGAAGTHDGNVSHINNQQDLSVNFVVSAGRITAMVPIFKIALTTGQRNPYAWKSENDPLITTTDGELGYLTMGYLHYIIEKLNPHLVGQPIRLHKEFYSTSCSALNVARVREIAEAFRTGKLDPTTGKAPVTPSPEPEPEPEPIEEYVNPATLTEIRESYRALGDALEKLPKE